MKNKLLLLGVLLSYFCLCSNAEVVVTGPDSDDQKNEKGTTGPRSSLLTIETETNGDELTIDINRYVGNVLVSVVAQDGCGSYANTYCINGHSSFTIDFSEFTDGTYTLVLTLQNGTIYSGQITKY